MNLRDEFAVLRAARIKWPRLLMSISRCVVTTDILRHFCRRVVVAGTQEETAKRRDYSRRSMEAIRQSQTPHLYLKITNKAADCGGLTVLASCKTTALNDGRLGHQPTGADRNGPDPGPRPRRRLPRSRGS